MKKKLFGTWGLLILAIIIVAGLLIIPKFIPGKLDGFASCLKEKNVKYYGAYWCPNCKNQSNMFGNSKKYLPYIECAIQGVQNEQTAECAKAGIKAYPTWEFSNGERVEGVQALEFLSEKSGCELSI